MTTGLLAFRDDASVTGFRAVLEALKRRGCTLLVTGEVDDRVRSVAARKLLGSPAADRGRVLVVAGRAGDAASRLLPGGIGRDDEGVRTVAHRPAGATGAGTADAVADDLDALAAAVDDLAARRDGFEPAELRLCVDALPALLDRYGTDEVAGFVRAVGDAVVARDGMGHFHLPVDDGAAVVSAAGEYVDARVELRQGGAAAAEQRWHVPGCGTTQWVTL